MVTPADKKEADKNDIIHEAEDVTKNDAQNKKNLT